MALNCRISFFPRDKYSVEVIYGTTVELYVPFGTGTFCFEKAKLRFKDSFLEIEGLVRSTPKNLVNQPLCLLGNQVGKIGSITLYVKERLVRIDLTTKLFGRSLRNHYSVSHDPLVVQLFGKSFN